MMNHSLMILAGLRLEFGRVHWTSEEGKSQHGWFKGHMTIGLFAVNITHLHPRHLKGWLWKRLSGRFWAESSGLVQVKSEEGKMLMNFFRKA